ncbi:MAG: HRDC domain-containing protein [Dialister invisus]
MVSRLPRTEEEMAEVHGIGAFKLKKYGERFLAALGEFSGAEEIRGKKTREKKKTYMRNSNGSAALWQKKKICRHHKFFPIQSSGGSQKPVRQPKRNSAV